MPERAEVEAVADIIFRVFCRTTTYNRVSREWAIEAAGEVLGRVRDARGDDEAGREVFTTHWVPREEWLKVCAERDGYMIALDAIRARSPQGESNEGGNQ